MHPRLLDRVPEPEADNRSLELAHLCTGSGTWRGSGSTGAGTSTSRSVSRLMSSPIVHLLSSPEQMWWVRQAPCRSHPEMIYADWSDGFTFMLRWNTLPGSYSALIRA